jgi:hypothetical protein
VTFSAERKVEADCALRRNVNMLWSPPENLINASRVSGGFELATKKEHDDANKPTKFSETAIDT